MNNWREVRLGDVADIIMGQSPKSIYYNNVGEGLKFLQGNRTFGRIYPTYDTYTIKATKIAEKGDILISVRAPVGDINLANTKCCIGRGISAIRSKENNLFLFYNLIYNKKRLKTAENGTTYGSINKGDLENFKIKLPDLETQEKIADVLSSYDKLIENNNRRIKILEETAEETYKEWFVRMRFPGHENTKFEKGIPKGWEVKKVEQLVKRLETGHFYKEDELEDEGKVIVIDQSEKEYLGYHNGEPTHRPSIENPIILFGDHSCKMIIMIGDFSLAENVIPFKSNSESPELFLYYSLKGLIKTQEYKRHWKELTSKKILYPEIDLQIKFANMMKDNILAVEKLKVVNQNLIKQRDLLLPRLMNGTIQVK